MTKTRHDAFHLRCGQVGLVLLSRIFSRYLAYLMLQARGVRKFIQDEQQVTCVLCGLSNCAVRYQ